MKKRLLSILTCLALCLSLLPATALAAEDTTPATPTVVEDYGMKIFANGTPITVEAGTDPGTSKVWYDDQGHKTYLDLDPDADGEQTELDISTYNIYGGTNSSDFEGNTKITMTGGKVNGIISGSHGEMTGSTSITMTGGEVTGVIYGAYTKINGSVTIDLHSGTVRTIYGVYVDSSDCDVLVNVCGGTITGFNTGQSVVSIYILGQCNSHTVDISGGIVTGDVYGGLSKTSGNCKSAAVNISGGTVNGNIYGGGKAYVLGDAAVTVSGGTVNGNIDISSNVKGSGTITVSGGTVKGSIDATPTQDGSSGTITLKDEAHVQIPADGTLKAKNSITLGSGYARTAADGNFLPVEDNATLTSTTNGYYEYVGANHNKNIQIDENDHGHVCTSENCAIGGVSIVTGQHDDWKYSVSGLTITKTCGTCGYEAATATLSDPAADAPTYDGTAKEATMTQEGSWGDSEITLTYAGTGISDSAAAPTAAGSYTATMTAGGKSVSVDFTIAPAALTVTGATATGRAYDGTSTVTITGVTLDGIFNSDAVSVDTTGLTGALSSPNAGSYTEVTLPTLILTGGAGNYTLTQPTAAVTTTVTISKAAHANLTAATQNLFSSAVTTQSRNYTFDLAETPNFPTDGGTMGYAVKTDGTYAIADDTTPFVGSVLHYTVATPQAKDTADNIVVTVSSTNYEDFDVTIPMVFVDKTDAQVTISGAPTSAVTYGDADIRLTATAGDPGTGTGVWTWSSSAPDVLQVTGSGSTATVKILKSGSATITVKYESDTTIAEVPTAAITVNKAALTVKPKNVSIYNGTAMPTPEVEYVGLKNGDAGATVAALTSGTLDMEIKAADNTTTLADTKTNGTYQIVFIGTPVFAVSDQYEITTGNGTLTISTRPSSGGGGGGYTPPVQNVTVPISGDDNTIHVGASVNGDKATVKNVDLDHLDTVIGDHVDTGTVTIDFSGLNSSKPITTVELPSNVVKQIAEAVNDPGNDAQSLEVVLSNGLSIEFDAEALGEKAAQADGQDITISIQNSKDAKPNQKQEAALKGRPAYDITVTSGGEHISDMGGKITVHAPYELQDGEHPRGIVVWYVDEDGKRERCETSYDPVKKRVNWKTDHLSLYMIDYDERFINPFTDISEDKYYYDAVLWAVDSGITNGTSATTFSPDVSCTRAQMATFLWRAAGSPNPAGSTNPFTDVSADAYYAKAVQWAYEQGITGGTSATTFSPDAPCTRGQMATFLWRNAGSPATTGSANPFTDVSDDAYYAKAVQWAYEQEITGGTSATTFSPDADCTRAQMVTFLYRNFEE